MMVGSKDGRKVAQWAEYWVAKTATYLVDRSALMTAASLAALMADLRVDLKVALMGVLSVAWKVDW